MTLVDRDQPAGTYRLRFPTTGLSSGVYFLRLQVGGTVQQRKLMHLQ